MARRVRFVTPEVVRLPLSDGDWIEVKKRLSVGEERQAFQQIVGEIKSDGWRRPNLEMVGIAEMIAYLVDWSFRDARDKPVKVTIDAIRQLDLATFRELETVLTAHVTAMDAAEADTKNEQSGEPGSATTSPSVE